MGAKSDVREGVPEAETTGRPSFQESLETQDLLIWIAGEEGRYYLLHLYLAQKRTSASKLSEQENV
jgi:hypothetical protein